MGGRRPVILDGRAIARQAAADPAADLRALLLAFSPEAAIPPMAAIEALLDRRPDAATRNWTPGETVDDLAAENRAHEIEHDI
jgi:hypothetical protein